MATQISDIITDAFRESNLIPLNASPTAPETTEGLNRLQAIIKSVLGNEVGYIMQDWAITSASNITRPSGVALSSAQAAAWYVQPQARLQCDLSTATSIDLDPYPNDGQRFSVVDVGGNFASNNLTLDGNGRKVNSSSNIVFSTNDEVREFMYRADLGDWVEIDNFATDDNLPFPEDFNDYFTTALAMRLNPRYGRPLPPEAAARYDQQRLQIIERYNQSRLRGIGLEKRGLAPGE